ncbi:MAG: bifunctional riboflavin kinase/FMN adenylyltransferase, partial [Pseudomonadota bacterium]
MVTRRPVIAAIGNFDGVHRGHQHLLKRTIELAASEDAAPGVVIFDPHPRRHFQPDTPPFLLTTAEDRAALLRDEGIAEVMVLTFDKSVSSLSPAAFVDTVLKDQLGLGGIVAGADFRFGAKRAGDG